jgi:hypothetical protein
VLLKYCYPNISINCLYIETSENPIQLLLGLLFNHNPPLAVLQLIARAGLGHCPAYDDLIAVEL